MPTAGETNVPISEWSTGTLKVYHDDKIAALAEANDERHKFYAEIRTADKALLEERDRRYTEVNIEREKALKIKETADLAALGLAREIQTYKDEKANQLREQINSERGLYATNEKVDTALKPINDFISSQQGKTTGLDKIVAYLIAVAAIAVAVLK